MSLIICRVVCTPTSPSIMISVSVSFSASEREVAIPQACFILLKNPVCFVVLSGVASCGFLGVLFRKEKRISLPLSCHRVSNLPEAVGFCQKVGLSRRGVCAIMRL